MPPRGKLDRAAAARAAVDVVHVVVEGFTDPIMIAGLDLGEECFMNASGCHVGSAAARSRQLAVSSRYWAAICCWASCSSRDVVSKA
jgi:hypothetical protein